MAAASRRGPSTEDPDELAAVQRPTSSSPSRPLISSTEVAGAGAGSASSRPAWRAVGGEGEPCEASEVESGGACASAFISLVDRLVGGGGDVPMLGHQLLC